MGAGLHGEVGPCHGRTEVGVGDRPAPPSVLGHPVVSGTVLAGAVEVLVAGQAPGDGRLQPGPAEGVLVALVLHPQLALGPAEVGQQVGVAPARAAVGVAPVVVVGPVAADVDHAVDRRAAPERPPARPGDDPPSGVSLGNRHVVPGQRTAPQGRGGGRHGDLGEVVGRSALQDQDAGGGVLAQPSRDHAPRAPGADDDVVVHEHLQRVRCRLAPLSRRRAARAAHGVHAPCPFVHGRRFGRPTSRRCGGRRRPAAPGPRRPGAGRRRRAAPRAGRRSWPRRPGSSAAGRP